MRITHKVWSLIAHPAVWDCRDPQQHFKHCKDLTEPWVMILGKSLSKSVSECTFIMNSRIAVTSCHDYPLASSVPDSRCRQLSPKFGDCCRRCLYVLKSGWSWLYEFTPRSHLSCLVVIMTHWKAGQPKHRFQVQPSYTQGRKLVTNHSNKGLAHLPDFQVL